MNRLAAFLAGAVFAAGLAISGMTRPDVVVGFLDITGAWDPSLAAVMGGAIGVHAVAYRLVPRAARPLLAERFRVPSRRDIDLRLVVGASLFGLGWGLGGICPGPALASLPAGDPHILVFAVAMLAGMGLFARLDAMSSRPSAPLALIPDDA